MAGTALVAATMLAAGGAAAADKKMMKSSIGVNGYYEGVVGGILYDSQETTHSYMGVDNGGTAPTVDDAYLAVSDRLEARIIDQQGFTRGSCRRFGGVRRRGP